MTRIDGTNGVNNDIKININNVNDTSKKTINSAFGAGFAGSDNMGFVSVDTRFQNLAAQFDFEVPKYPKGGYAQFNPSESDYQSMKHLDMLLDKPEAEYCEC